MHKKQKEMHVVQSWTSQKFKCTFLSDEKNIVRKRIGLLYRWWFSFGTLKTYLHKSSLFVQTIPNPKNPRTKSLFKTQRKRTRSTKVNKVLCVHPIQKVF